MNERDRVLQVMQSEGMNAKQFCQEVGISQGTLSNIMGGRNKPSLDVMQAILRRFRSVNCDWLIMGIGTMYLTGAREGSSLTLFDMAENGVGADAVAVKGQSLTSKQLSVEVGLPVDNTMVSSSRLRTVEKVLIFYSDGTFEER